jgi:dTDP-4-amino-4,6-dideoxygalactose transaminase
VRTDRASELQAKLASEGVKSIVPIEAFELLGQADLLPNALQLTQSTLSIPVFPSLGVAEASRIARLVRDFI